MLFWIFIIAVIVILLILVIIGKIPLRLWIAQSNAKRLGKTTRRKISRIKKFYNGEPRPISMNVLYVISIIVILVIAISSFALFRTVNTGTDTNASGQKDTNNDSEIIKYSEDKTISGYVEDNDSQNFSEESNSFYETGIVFPESSSRYLSYEEIETLEDGYIYPVDRMLEYAINEIYAREGYDFQMPKWKEYYSKFSWYHNLGYSDEETVSRFNKYEKENVDKLSNKRDEVKNP